MKCAIDKVGASIINSQMELWKAGRRDISRVLSLHFSRLEYSLFAMQCKFHGLTQLTTLVTCTFCTHLIKLAKSVSMSGIDCLLLKYCKLVVALNHVSTVRLT